MPKRKIQVRVQTAFSILVKIIIYAAFASAYYFLVLFLLRDWLKDTFDDHRVLYTAVVLPLIIGQAVLLDLVIFGLRKLGSEKSK